jgi:hypothetical protein
MCSFFFVSQTLCYYLDLMKHFTMFHFPGAVPLVCGDIWEPQHGTETAASMDPYRYRDSSCKSQHDLNSSRWLSRSDQYY